MFIETSAKAGHNVKVRDKLNACGGTPESEGSTNAAMPPQPTRHSSGRLRRRCPGWMRPLPTRRRHSVRERGDGRPLLRRVS